MFNFKNNECQEIFLNLTSQTERFSGCLKHTQNFEAQAQKQNKNLNSFFHQYFKKVKICKYKPKETEVTKLLDEIKD